MTQTKRCRGCGEYKDISEYYRNSRQPDGVGYYCKDCCKLSRRLEAVRKRDKRSKISHRQYQRAVQEKVAADKSITLVEVYKKFRGHCCVCGGYVIPGEASLDHVTPIAQGGGHTWENIQLVHLVCNLRKSNLSHQQAVQNSKKSRRRSPFVGNTNTEQ